MLRITKRKTLFVLPALLVALAGAATSTQAHAEDSKEAFEHFDRGVALYKAGAFDVALSEFETAYKLTSNYRLLFNIALCKSELKDNVGALEAFRRYLSEGGDQVDKTKREEVNEQIQKLQAAVTRVTIRSNAPAGAELLIDDQKAGTFPLSGPLLMSIGRRKFTVNHGARTISKTSVVTGRDTAPIELMLPTESPAVSAGPTGSAGAGGSTGAGGQPPVEPVTDRPSGPSFPWAPWAIAGVLGAGAAVTGILAVTARNDAATAQATFGSRGPDITPKQDRANAFGIATDVLIGLTAVAVGFGTYFTIRFLGADDPSKKKAHAGTATHTPRRVQAPTMALQVAPTGALLTGGF